MKTLEGRTALVTGAALRVGRHLALALAGAGADVAVHYNHSEQAAAETVDRMLEMGVRAVAVPGDLLDPAAPRRILSRAAASLGPIDILVNNASIFESGTAAGMDPEQWTRMQQINAHAPLELALAMSGDLPGERCGDIININDSQAMRPRADYFAYTASKIALHGQTGNLALELAPRVRVNEIALGAVLPPDSPPDSYRHTRRDQLPLGEFPTLEHVAGAMLFLLTNTALTGQTINVDAGQNLLS